VRLVGLVLVGDGVNELARALVDGRVGPERIGDRLGYEVSVCRDENVRSAVGVGDPKRRFA
jgi:hypothetical protein